MSAFINIAVQGCCHGELDAIYATILDCQEQQSVKVDLLLVCGDFQSIRSFDDFDSVAVPNKYKEMNSFHDYYSGKKVAPVPTVFIGGNHEASNLLQSLYYGGYVAPNIYFLGFGGVINFGGIRIAGLSGIFNEKHYNLGRYERPPYTEDTVRSVYHLREFEVFKMSLMEMSRRGVDIFLSHDWPKQIWDFGDCGELLRNKPFLRDDIVSGNLGSPPLMQLLTSIKPSLWFSAHLHVKFAAIVEHAAETLPPSTIAASSPEVLGETFKSVQTKSTRFLALDKVLPGRDFLQFIALPFSGDSQSLCIEYDPEWLAITKKTHGLLSNRRAKVNLPADNREYWPSEEEISAVEDRIRRCSNGTLIIPNIDAQPVVVCRSAQQGNIQTDRLLEMLDLNHVWTVSETLSAIAYPTSNIALGSEIAAMKAAIAGCESTPASKDMNEICLDDT